MNFGGEGRKIEKKGERIKCLKPIWGGEMIMPERRGWGRGENGNWEEKCKNVEKINEGEEIEACRFWVEKMILYILGE